MWEQLPSGRVRHRFEVLVLVATLAFIPVIIIENDAKSQTWQDVAWAANWVIWGIFAAELAFILTVAPKKWAALRAHWIDTTLVIVTAPPFGHFLSSLRLLRLARLLRLLRFGLIATRAIQAQRRLASLEDRRRDCRAPVLRAASDDPVPAEVPPLVVRLEPRVAQVLEPDRRLSRADGRPLPIHR
jgi:hypothetical protein